jgi:subtilisin-like proprotein convertase family protein
MKHARKMAIDSKVVSVSIEHSKVGDFTIDLRGEMPTEFVNVKMMSKLRLENAQK